MWKPIPVERVMGPSRNNMENYGEMQPIVRDMKPALWVPGENLSFGLLPKRYVGVHTTLTYQGSFALNCIGKCI